MSTRIQMTALRRKSSNPLGSGPARSAEPTHDILVSVGRALDARRQKHGECRARIK
jgi:hypothetical protein